MTPMEFDTPDDLHIVSFDPGETTGFAIWYNSALSRMGEIPFENLYEWLAAYPIDDYRNTVVIVEDYKILPSKAQAHVFNALKTVRVIGALDLWTHQNTLQAVYQMPAIKPVGYGRMGKKAGSGKGNHQWDAVAHIVYYLMRNYGG